MPKFTRTIDVTISKPELESMIRDYLKLPAEAKVNFMIGIAPSHPLDRHDTYEFTHAKATYQESN